MKVRAAAASASRRPSPRITLSEEDGVRYLHFGTVWVQGAMRIGRPWKIELEYQQQMMAPLLFLPEPARVLQLGLGAAALTRFCWKHLPRAKVSVVEVSDEVVAAARRWFALPPDDARLSVLIDDARRVVVLPRLRRRFDWLQVDLYDRSARGPVLDDEPFYAACRRLLRAPGIAVFNLFGRGFEPSFARIAAAFGGRALALPEADAGNRVVLAFGGPQVAVPWAELHERARLLERQFGLPARRWVAGLMAQAQDAARLTV
ncbi:MAG: spermidine synthase [Burkholderiaceae bacterium]|jgi:spermidine synthase|nr:spermidine synthase [Burkholderiaceae bacterium]